MSTLTIGKLLKQETILSGSGSHKVKVVCRVRPFLKQESSDDSVTVDADSVRIENQRNKAERLKYIFSSTYGPKSTQSEIFQKDVRPLIEHVFQGLDATIFAYGVTGSGKTHTMQGTDQEPGIIPRSVQMLFSEKKQRIKDGSRIEVRFSYMEIYKELVYDLLMTRDAQGTSGLQIREDGNHNIFVANLSEKEIVSYEEFARLYSVACKNRSTATTKLNVHSSRSHAILTLYVTITEPMSTNANIIQKTLTGKVNLIDLAGSEDNRRTENGKDRMAESGAINKSLFVLGQVVEALNNGSSRVPYRDSKMTRILQDSLGGKSLGMMIVNIAPGQDFYMDTYNTLNFATKSKEIENKPVVNELIDLQPPTRNTSLGKPLRAIENEPTSKNIIKRYSDSSSVTTNNSGSTKRLSDSVIDSNRPSKRVVLQERSFSNLDSMANKSDDTGRGLGPSRRLAASNSLFFGKGISDIAVEQIKIANREEIDLETKVSMILDKKMKEMSENGQMLSPLLRKHNILGSEVQSRLETLEQRLESKRNEIEIASLLSPETKTKTALAHARLGKKAQVEGQLKIALEHYEKAAVFLPGNQKLNSKIREINDTLSGNSTLIPEKTKLSVIAPPPKPQKQKSKKSLQSRLFKSFATVSQSIRAGSPCSFQSNNESESDDEEGETDHGCDDDSEYAPTPYKSERPTKEKRQKAPQPYLSTEQLTKICECILAMINKQDLKIIKTLKGVGAKRAQQILDLVVHYEGGLRDIKDLKLAGLSENILNGIIKANAYLIEI